jgi:hypothetical protein
MPPWCAGLWYTFGRFYWVTAEGRSRIPVASSVSGNRFSFHLITKIQAGASYVPNAPSLCAFLEAVTSFSTASRAR